MKRLTAISISGGIDSLVAAYLLKEQGHDVIGIHFTTGYEIRSSDDNKNIVDEFVDGKRTYKDIKIIKEDDTDGFTAA